MKPIKSLRGKAREEARRQERAKIDKKASVAAAVALANFDMVAKQPDGSQRVCAVLSEETKASARGGGSVPGLSACVKPLLSMESSGGLACLETHG